jgi:hypothetical protein
VRDETDTVTGKNCGEELPRGETFCPFGKDTTVTILRGAPTDEGFAAELFDGGAPRRVGLFEECFEVGFEPLNGDGASAGARDVAFSLDIVEAVRIAEVSAGRAVADVAEFAALLGAADINGISGSVVLGSVNDECVTTNDTTVSVCVEVRHRVSPMVVCMRGLWRVTESGFS